MVVMANLAYLFILISMQIVLGILDCLFYEGSNAFLRIALTWMSLNVGHYFSRLCEAMKHAIQMPGSFSRKWVKEFKKRQQRLLSAEQQ